ncbi:unnamed protein product [Moneuplotes crassus]|uniref:Uncharacterized protein n=1 Tax=Euplotes crassus TaxID=5936 RepID=A0AAD1UN57_EUPCR|nr:unnamed protein product [Moneuplotes crassus]
MIGIEEIHDIQFSLDKDYIFAITDQGVIFLSSDPDKEVENYETRDISNIELLQSYNNIIAYVQNNKKGSRKMLKIYDDYTKSDIFKIKFDSRIIDLKISINGFMVILKEKAYLFNCREGKKDTWKTPKLVKKFKTPENRMGIGCFLSYKTRNFAILPSERTKVQIYDSKQSEDIEEFDVEQDYSLLSANLHGEVFALPNEDGTEIFLHKIFDGSCISSYTRGSSPCQITSIEFDRYCERLACCSEKETIHVFSLPKELASGGVNLEEEKDSQKAAIPIIDKTIPPTKLDERPNQGGGWLWNSEGKKSYLKVKIESPDKILTIHNNKLHVITHDLVLYQIDIQNLGDFSIGSKELREIELFE